MDQDKRKVSTENKLAEKKKSQNCWLIRHIVVPWMIRSRESNDFSIGGIQHECQQLMNVSLVVRWIFDLGISTETFSCMWYLFTSATEFPSLSTRCTFRRTVKRKNAANLNAVSYQMGNSFDQGLSVLRHHWAALNNQRVSTFITVQEANTAVETWSGVCYGYFDCSYSSKIKWWFVDVWVFTACPYCITSLS